MIPTLDKHSSLEKQLETLKDFGVFKIDSYYAGDFLNKFYKETLNRMKGSYPFGKYFKTGPLSTLNKSTCMYEAFSAQWMKDLSKEYIGHNKQYCKEIYSTHDFLNDKGLGRNGFLHFDRKWAFKFFIYLTDVDKSCGAFSCVPGSHLLGKELRQNARKETKNYSKIRNRIFVDYNNLTQYKNKIEPVEAPKGTVIVFDTDVFHMGGKVKTGKERVVIRSHNRK